MLMSQTDFEINLEVMRELVLNFIIWLFPGRYEQIKLSRSNVIRLNGRSYD